MKLKHEMQFFDEEEVKVVSLGTSVFDEPAIESPVVTPIEEPVVIKKEEPIVPVIPTTVDAKELAREFGETLRQHLPTAPVVKEPEMSEAERKALLKVWEPTPEWIEKFDNLETRSAAIKEMHEGQLAQNDVITQVRIKQAVDEVMRHVAPAIQYMEEQAATRREETFNTKFPQLAKPEFRPFLSTITADLQRKGKTYASEDEMFTDIGTAAEAVMQQLDPNFKLSTGSTPVAKTKPKSAPPASALKAVTPGSGGGGGGNVVVAATKPRGLAIFD